MWRAGVVFDGRLCVPSTYGGEGDRATFRIPTRPLWAVKLVVRGGESARLSVGATRGWRGAGRGACRGEGWGRAWRICAPHCATLANSPAGRDERADPRLRHIEQHCATLGGVAAGVRNRDGCGYATVRRANPLVRPSGNASVTSGGGRASLFVVRPSGRCRPKKRAEARTTNMRDMPPPPVTEALPPLQFYP